MVAIKLVRGSARENAPNRDTCVKRGLEFLASRAALFFPAYLSDTSDFEKRLETPPEVFTPALILNALSECGIEPDFLEDVVDSLMEAFTDRGLVHFFRDRDLLPADIDCTAVLLETMHRYQRVLKFEVDGALSRVARNRDDQGVLRVYIDPDPSRVDRLDAAACANALYTFELFETVVDARPTLEYIEKYLRSDDFEQGTRYYPSPDVILMFLSRWLRDAASAPQPLRELARLRTSDRLRQTTGNALDLAARVTAANNLGLSSGQALERLISLQRSDGSWPAAPCFKFGRNVRYFGSESLTTAFALRALKLNTYMRRQSGTFLKSTVSTP
ncbi:MAG TPA: hypothetical protein VFQ61_30735 [Polyangiaceae bacterium]|nr:hypothetical protein [Polyangiaceae bacterium]